MRKCRLAVALAGAFLLAIALAEAYSIPADKVDAQKIFFGRADSFEKPGEVNYEHVLKATPEYDEIKKKKIERGSAKYWILASQASDRAVRMIAEVGGETDYDLITASGYLGSLETPIKADDITSLVLAKLEKDKGK